MGDANPVIQFLHTIAGLLIVITVILTLYGITTGRHIK